MSERRDNKVIPLLADCSAIVAIDPDLIPCSHTAVDDRDATHNGFVMFS